jgi:uncharacterized membrane protein YgcG
MIRRVLLVLLAAVPLYAKSLHWRSVDVRARLDADGRLHVVERQQMVFDGDWNGGERDFGVRPGQSVLVNRITRIEGDREIPLEAGDADQVDHWTWADSGTVRWRSRMPQDPPFRNRELTYVLDYTYGNVLTPVDGRFRLAHDFGLPLREGTIELFTLNVDFDPVWNFQHVSETRMPLEPGQSAIVQANLAYRAEGWPAGVTRPLPWWVGLAAIAFFALGATLLIRAFIRAERETGRFAPLPARFDPELLQLQPELAGAAWDASVGPAEVAALLARMSQEGKITTRVEGDVLHLKLNVDAFTLTRYEKMLVLKLFITDETDTTQIREHYKGTGFNPAAEIRPGIEATLAEAIPQWTVKVRRFNSWIHVATLPAALLVVAAAALFSDEPGAFLESVFLGTIFGLVASLAARAKSREIADFRSAFIGPGILLGVPVLAFTLSALKAAGSRVGAPLLFAVALWLLALLHLVLNLLKIRDTREVIAFRKRIAGARQFIVDQLQLPQPALRDEWFPYVLAFGLGMHVDRWFRAFGGSGSHVSSGSSSRSSSSSSSSSFSGGSSWTGGGGAFGGAGATGSWALAAGAIAAGVAAPGSSDGGGGGGGGGGSSSGGGGGGGW